ncbi:MAG: DNA polymerase IV, partial [Clostridia bacterium]|nr:DNA polymerase IV [Clostridia bacterium]
MERIIIHSDMNSCYASVECSLNPSLRGKPVAVGGSEAHRHGIILAKSEEAKRFGVKTGEALWQAKQKCPDLIIIEPHFEEYIKYSRLAHDIYARYTDRIEPMGLDEVWCDITGSIKAFGSKEQISEEIRTAFKEELGVTVSIGISFNKIFAKLGSDLAGKDEVYEIGKDDFKDKIWHLPATAIMGVGRSTGETLRRYGVKTIGDLACCDPHWLKLLLGVMGEALWKYANGLDNSRVMPDGYRQPIKSVGHGVTCSADLVNADEVWKVFLSLSQDVSKQLKKNKLEATGVQIGIRDNQLVTRQLQCPTEFATQSATEIAKIAMRLFEDGYNWAYDVRAVTVRAINLQKEGTPYQLDFLSDSSGHERQKKIDDTVL